MPDKERVVLIGMGPTTDSALAGLLTRFEVVTLVRNASNDDSAIQRAHGAGVHIAADESIAGIRRILTESTPDCVIVSSYNRILPADLIASTAFINVHYSPLPRYRGRAAVNWAIINGEPHTAISVHELVPQLDGGGLLFQEMISIGDKDTVTDLYVRLNEIQERVLPAAVSRLLGGDHGEQQDESRATYACTRVPADGEIGWDQAAADIDRLVRALTQPFPGAFTWLEGKQVVVDRVEPLAGPQYEGVVPGRITRIDRSAGFVDVLTRKGLLRIHAVRVDGEPYSPARIVNSLGTTFGLRGPSADKNS